MTEREKFIKHLRELAAKSPRIMMLMPRNSVGLPEGLFDPKSLLDYLADCLDGKVD